MTISTIVVTGGPCGGKSTAAGWIQETFAERGYTVLFVPETATELITAGAAPQRFTSTLLFQETLLKLQMDKERAFLSAAKSMNAEKVLIVCDRGAMDNKAYISPEEFSALMRHCGTDEVTLRERYDAVFHLVTAAKGARKFYTLENNAARTETPEEAAALDDRLIAAWTGHPHLRVIGNSDNFEGKMRHLVSEISDFLGEPIPKETERKFLIDYPDLEKLEAKASKVEISQTYLRSPEDVEIRIRRRGNKDGSVYFRTVKRRVGPATRLESETRISEEQYRILLGDADPARRTITKTRYYLMHEDLYFVVDVYPFWKDRAIAEIEVPDLETPITFPDFLHVSREVTGDEDYRNASLAARY